MSGGARGQGAIEARLFAHEGAKVVIGDLLEEEGKQVEAEINASGGACLFVKLALRGNIATRSMFGPLSALQRHRTTVWCRATTSVGCAEKQLLFSIARRERLWR
jgi:NAD(P)-dependent dehydrogenase (short-subunit alcohol dehydrogenase family)